MVLSLAKNALVLKQFYFFIHLFGIKYYKDSLLKGSISFFINSQSVYQKLKSDREKNGKTCFLSYTTINLFYRQLPGLKLGIMLTKQHFRNIFVL